jgi:hypothetical protein
MSAGYSEAGGVGVDSDDGVVIEPGVDVENESSQPTDKILAVNKKIAIKSILNSLPIVIPYS